MTTATLSRHIACDGVFNLRDLGGYRSSDGRTVRWRTLFRADGLHRVPQGRSRPLGGLGLRTVLDLRTFAEREQGCFDGDGIRAIHLPILPTTWDPATCADIEDGTAFLVDRYLEMTAVGAMAIAAAVELLASATLLPAVFHCSAGKDRTGVLAAVVLGALGVADEDIAADYALSAGAVDQLRIWMASNHPETAARMAAEPVAFGACPADAMVRFLERLRNRFDSMEGYLAAIDVAPTTIESLRATLLDDGS